MIRIASSAIEIKACFDVMAQLRPHLERASFAGDIRELMDDGYVLAYLDDDGAVAAVSGFRIAKNLFLGRHLYVEDLVTSESRRSRGVGATMMAWLTEVAREHGCSAIHLDSGIERHAAHRFYLGQGMDIVCHHFLAKVGT